VYILLEEGSRQAYLPGNIEWYEGDWQARGEYDSSSMGVDEDIEFGGGTDVAWDLNSPPHDNQTAESPHGFRGTLDGTGDVRERSLSDEGQVRAMPPDQV
jgi:hypothetical protein